jgi:hypothetical protein
VLKAMYHKAVLDRRTREIDKAAVVNGSEKTTKKWKRRIEYWEDHKHEEGVQLVYRVERQSKLVTTCIIMLY